VRTRIVRFARTTSALDRLADALRRAEATWRHGTIVDEWEQLTEAEQDDWRAIARTAAIAVVEELTTDVGRDSSG
jgi:hypothetical protein